MVARELSSDILGKRYFLLYVPALTGYTFNPAKKLNYECNVLNFKGKEFGFWFNTESPNRWNPWRFYLVDLKRKKVEECLFTYTANHPQIKYEDFGYAGKPIVSVWEHHPGTARVKGKHTYYVGVWFVKVHRFFADGRGRKFHWILNTSLCT